MHILDRHGLVGSEITLGNQDDARQFILQLGLTLQDIAGTNRRDFGSAVQLGVEYRLPVRVEQDLIDIFHVPSLGAVNN